MNANCIHALYGSLLVKGCLSSYSIACCHFYRSMACQVRSVTKLETEKVHLGRHSAGYFDPPVISFMIALNTSITN